MKVKQTRREVKQAEDVQSRGSHKQGVNVKQAKQKSSLRGK